MAQDSAKSLIAELQEEEGSQSTSSLIAELRAEESKGYDLDVGLPADITRDFIGGAMGGVGGTMRMVDEISKQVPWWPDPFRGMRGRAGVAMEEAAPTSGKEGFMPEVVRASGQTVPYIAAGAAASVAGGPVGAGLAIAYLAAVGEGGQEYFTQIEHDPSNPEAAWKAFAIGGAYAAATEALPLGPIAGRIGRVLKRVNEASGGALQREVTRGVLTNLAREGAAEFLQEGGQSLVSDIIAEHLREDEVPVLEALLQVVSDPEAWKQAGYAGAVGSVAVGPVSVFGTALEKRSQAAETTAGTEGEPAPPEGAESVTEPQGQAETAEGRDVPPSAAFPTVAEPTGEKGFLLPESERMTPGAQEAVAEPEYVDPVPLRRKRMAEIADMPLEGMQAARAEIEAEERSVREKILGPEASERWDKAERMGRDKIVDEIESGLSEEDIDILHGLGDPAPAVRDVEDMIQAVEEAEAETGSEEDVIREATRLVRKMGGQRDPSKMSGAELEAFAAMRHLMQRAQEEGYDTAAIGERVGRALARIYPDPSDTEFMLRTLMPELEPTGGLGLEAAEPAALPPAPVAQEALEAADVPTEAEIPDATEPETPASTGKSWGDFLSEARNTVVDTLDKWMKKRDLLSTRADTDAAAKERALRRIHGLEESPTLIGGVTRGVVQAIKQGATQQEIDPEVRKSDRAIQLHIDLLDAQEQGYGTPEALLEEVGQENLSPEQLQTFDDSQNLSQEELALAQQIIEENQEMGFEGMEAGVIQNARDYYSARLWQPVKEGKAGAKATAKFTRTTVRGKPRTYKSILHGWANGRDLQVTGAVQAQAVARKQVSQAIIDRNLLEAGKKAGIFTTSKKDAEEKDWREVTHPNVTERELVARATAAKDIKTYPGDVYADRDGNIWRRSPVYAPKPIAKHLNNVLGRSAIADITGVETATKVNAYLKAQILFTSLFHHQAFIRSFVFGTPLADTAKVLQLRKMYDEGQKAIENFGAELQLLVENGLTIGKRQDFDELNLRERGTISKKIDRVAATIPGGKQFAGAVRALMEQQAEFLFNHMGPNLKVMTALLEYKHQLHKQRKALESGEMTHDDVAKMVANIVNDDFGGLNHARLGKAGRNPTVQHVFRLVALAPDWTESNVRTMVKSFKAGKEGAMYRAMWGRVLAKAGLATVLWNIAMSILGDDDLEEIYGEATKRPERLRFLDMDITPIYQWLGNDPGKRKYFSLVGHFRDPVKFIVNPIRSAKHKSSVLGGFVQSLAFGEDWAGRPYTTAAELLGLDDKGVYETSRKGQYRKGQPKGGKMLGETASFRADEKGNVTFSTFPSLVISELRGTAPIQIQNLSSYLGGEMDAFDAITKSLGFMVSTSYPEEK